MTTQKQIVRGAHDNVRFNAIVNIMDGTFFGAGLGFASFTTVIPLFVSLLTNSAILIGLAPAIHNLGWQLPQLPLAGRVARLARYKPTVLSMTIHERLPFLGLAIVAWLLPILGAETALLLVFLLLVWQGFGGGFTANVWQSMIAKIIPERLLGRFFGLQMSGVYLLMSAGAVAAGLILERYGSQVGFTLTYAIAFAAMVISFSFLAMTREREVPPAVAPDSQTTVWAEVRRLLAIDRVFRRFLVIRMIFQLGMVAFSFYAVYAVGSLGVGVGVVGVLTGLMVFFQMLANPFMGALGDRTNHFLVLFLGTLAALLSTLLAGFLNSTEGLYLVFALAGIASVAGFTTTMVLSLGFGSPAEQSTYIGMSNTFIAPFTLAAPFLAGWMINAYGYQAMFRACAAVFFIAAFLSVSLLLERKPVDSSPQTDRPQPPM